MEANKTLCTPKKGRYIHPSWTDGGGNISKKKIGIVTQGKTEYTDFRKWRVMRSQMAYVPTGKTVVFQWQLQVGHHTLYANPKQGG